MKLTKKLGLTMIAIMLVAVCSGFAQNSEYLELLNKAKQYEANKKYVYALCTYYDAMMSDPANAEEAYGRYNIIGEAIQNGQPGLEEYDDFSIRDKWIELRKEYEKYWSENCALDFMFGDIEKGDINYGKKTATYTVPIKTVYNKKSVAISNIIITGFGKAYKKDWFEQQNSVTIFTPKDGDVYSIYKKYGVALVCFPNTNGKPAVFVDMLSNPETIKIANMILQSSGTWIDFSVVKTCAFGYKSSAKFYNSASFDNSMHCDFIKEYKRNLSVRDELAMETLFAFMTKEFGTDASTVSHYRVVVSICDSNGKRILREETAPPVPGEMGAIKFYDVNSSIMSKLDSGECTVSIDEVYLRYGEVAIKNEVGDNAGFKYYQTFDFSKMQKVRLNINNFSMDLDDVKASIDEAVRRKAEEERRKKAMISRKENMYSDCLKKGEEEMIRSVCLTVKSSKNTTKEELVKNATAVWKDIYYSAKDGFDSYNEFSDIEFPEYDEAYAAKIFESKIENILITTDKKGKIVLTSAGKKIK